MFRYQETHNWKSLSYQLLHLHGGWLAEPKVTVIPDAAGAARCHQGQIQLAQGKQQPTEREVYATTPPAPGE